MGFYIFVVFYFSFFIFYLNQRRNLEQQPIHAVVPYNRHEDQASYPHRDGIAGEQHIGRYGHNDILTNPH